MLEVASVSISRYQKLKIYVWDWNSAKYRPVHVTQVDMLCKSEVVKVLLYSWISRVYSSRHMYVIMRYPLLNTIKSIKLLNYLVIFDESIKSAFQPIWYRGMLEEDISN